MPSILYRCPLCDMEIEFDIEPYVEGNISGPADSWYPPEGGTIDGPDSCPSCNVPFDLDAVLIYSQDLHDANEEDSQGEL